MAYTVSQHAVLKQAKMALDALFAGSAPDAWLGCRQDYGDLRHMLKEAGKDAAEELERREAQRSESNERLLNWRRTPKDLKRHWILDAVGEGECAHGVIVVRMRRAHPECNIFEPYIKPLTKDMLRTGDIVRTPTGATGSQTKWLYRLPEISPDVAALEHALVA
jgi:hypothetical protein